MSAKRSWDVRRESVGSAPAAPTRTRQTLKAKRSERRKRLGIIGLILLALALCGLVYLLWQPYVRISEVTAEGPHAESVEQVARESLWGTFFHALPRNSIFIYPEIEVRERILEMHPDIVAVSISRTGFTSVLVKSVPRNSAFEWCGTTAASMEGCYAADAEGLVFAQTQAPPVAELVLEGATTTEPVAPQVQSDPGVLRIYAPLVYKENAEPTPIRAHVVGASRIPDILRFVKAMNLLGVSIASVEIREDEADLYTPENTRITYILGGEEAAAAVAASAFPTLNIPSGDLVYVDLRFDGKVYLKRHSNNEVVESL